MKVTIDFTFHVLNDRPSAQVSLMILAQVINNFFKRFIDFWVTRANWFQCTALFEAFLNSRHEGLRGLKDLPKDGTLIGSGTIVLIVNCVHECVTSANKLVKDKSVFSFYKRYNLPFLRVCFQILPCTWTRLVKTTGQRFLLHEQKYKLQSLQLTDKLAIVWATFSYNASWENLLFKASPHSLCRLLH